MWNAAGQLYALLGTQKSLLAIYQNLPIVTHGLLIIEHVLCDETALNLASHSLWHRFGEENLAANNVRETTSHALVLPGTGWYLFGDLELRDSRLEPEKKFIHAAHSICLYNHSDCHGLAIQVVLDGESDCFGDLWVLSE